MKKVLSIAMMLLAVMTAGAQVETLTPMKVEADPMTNTSGGVEWLGKHVCISLPDKGIPWIILYMKDHIFVKNYSTKIGYYTANDSLIGMATMVSPQPTQDGTRMMIGASFAKDSIPYAEYSDDKFVMKKAWRVRVEDVVKWLKETDGYIRIVTETYGNHLYDVKFRLKKED